MCVLLNYDAKVAGKHQSDGTFLSERCICLFTFKLLTLI